MPYNIKNILNSYGFEKNLKDKNIYIKSKKFNGKILERPYITYNEILNGGVLEFKMTN